MSKRSLFQIIDIYSYLETGQLLIIGVSIQIGIQSEDTCYYRKRALYLGKTGVRNNIYKTPFGLSVHSTRQSDIPMLVQW